MTELMDRLNAAPCWEQAHCRSEAGCPARSERAKPCWTLREKPFLQARCQECAFYRRHTGENVWVYRINDDDVLTYASQNWDAFASDNEAEGTATFDVVRGRSLWDFVAGAETSHLQKALVEKVRKTQAMASFPIHCDSPTMERVIDIMLLPLPDSGIEFRCRLIRKQERDPVAILCPHVARADAFLRMCSYCKQIVVSDGRWVSLATAVRELKIFTVPPLPQITHTVCPACFEQAMNAIEDDEVDSNARADFQG